jgi:hypothetical protein
MLSVRKKGKTEERMTAAHILGELIVSISMTWGSATGLCAYAARSTSSTLWNSDRNNVVDACIIKSENSLLSVRQILSICCLLPTNDPAHRTECHEPCRLGT